ncbi:hypothetical protein [Pseudomonas sp. LD120]|uniref:hypothetical protein n=1 Tax=Pseudomonas sp. LD120 TaxID=485751 RepID=UPI0013572425|nr:hypothetical protein [Pseudomonas sp. LD120]KAF0864437.1 hypothetical protein PLD_28005 [Pseudomonas sp. LD120]
MPSAHTLLLHHPGPRPGFCRVAEHLWGAGCNVDSDGDSRTPDDEQWTELTLRLRDSSEQRLDIDPLSQAPLVLRIRASEAELGTRAAHFIQSVAGGILQTHVTDR